MTISKWQKMLLPFLLTIFSALAVCFVIFYFIHINNIQKELENSPKFQSTSIATENQKLKHWNDLKDLEQYSISNRNYNARLIIRSRLLIISLSFLTGVVLCFIGAIFILGKFSENQTTIEGGQENINLKLGSSSPGIILSFFGLIIIGISISSKIELNVSESPLFILGTSENLYQEDISSSHLEVDSIKKDLVDNFIKKYRPKN